MNASVLTTPDRVFQQAAENPQSIARSLGPDLVRAVACGMVVILHACVPYLTHPMPGLLWPVTDQPSPLCDRLFWSIEVFVMPLFLVLSGYYGYQALCRSDAQAFLKTRAKRLLGPLAFGGLVILPIDLYVWMLGLVAQGHMPISKMRSLKLPKPQGDLIWGLSHLWYLLYVFMYCALLVLAARWLSHRVPMRLRPAARRFGAAAIVVVGALTLWVAPEVVYGFQHAFYPIPSKWIYSATFFAGGAMVAIFDPQFRTIQRLSMRSTVLGVISTVAAVSLGCWSLQPSVIATPRTASDHLAIVTLACITVIAAWSMAMSLIGLAIAHAHRLEPFSRTTRAIRYFAAASFWIYLVHHPIVALTHVDLYWLAPQLPSWIKSIATTAIAITLGLVTYEHWIRNRSFAAWVGIESPHKSKPVPTKMPHKKAA